MTRDPASSETSEPSLTPGEVQGPARLRARPQREVLRRLEPGLQPLGLGTGRDGLVYVPRDLEEPAPLVVMLHGAGGHGRMAITPFLDRAESQGLVLLAVDSHGRTWDVIVGDYGADVAFIDRALQRVFSGVAIDPRRIAIEGFSDGASYALSLGLTNGDLFDAVIAFSPGFSAPDTTVGDPRIFMSHGTADRVLPIARTSRRVVSQLRMQGAHVRYDEFAGGHEVPSHIVDAALDWLLGGWDAGSRRISGSR